MACVRISEGNIEGDVIENPFGGTYYSFKGIPYAAPPVGDLRFKVNNVPNLLEQSQFVYTRVNKL